MNFFDWHLFKENGLILSLISIVLFGRIWNRFWLNRRIYCSNQSLKGRTSIITGSTSGIGFQLTKDFLRRGCRVIMACRNLNKAEICREKFISELKVNDLNLSIMFCDLSSLKSIELFAKEFLVKENRLDLLICNAGLAQSKEIFSEDSLNNIIQSNYLGHFYLINLLQDKLEESRPSRIIHLSSDLHHLIRSVDDENPWSNIFYRPRSNPYSLSKLCQILSNVYCKQSFLDRGINVFSVTPGLVSTSIDDPFEQSIPFIFRFVYRCFNLVLIYFYGKTIEKGCETIIFCSIEPSLEHSKDIYFQNCCVSRQSLLSKDIQLAQHLWKLTEEQLGKMKLTRLNEPSLIDDK